MTVSIGAHVVDRDQPPPSPEEQDPLDFWECRLSEEVHPIPNDRQGFLARLREHGIRRADTP
jgi:hypothetical protein